MPDHRLKSLVADSDDPATIQTWLNTDRQSVHFDLTSQAYQNCIDRT